MEDFPFEHHVIINDPSQISVKVVEILEKSIFENH